MKLLWLLAALLTVAAADPHPAFSLDGESSDLDTLMMPGVRRRAVRPARDNSAILFPGSPGHPDTAEPPVTTQPVGSDTLGLGPHPESDSVAELPDNLNDLDLLTLSRLNAITNISDFARLFDLSLPSEEFSTSSLLVSTRLGAPGGAPETAAMANCKPELRTVELNLTVEPNTMYFPTCVRLERCGGCCYGPLLTCRPTVTKVVKLKVLKTVITNTARRRGNRRRRRQNNVSYEEVDAIKHTSCACGCKVQEQDCNASIHSYNEGECSCVCKNKDEKAKCEEQNSTKYWDNDSCSCFCRKPQDCSTGEFFSQTSCRCERLTSRSGFVFPVSDSEGQPIEWTVPDARPTRRRKPVLVPLK